VEIILIIYFSFIRIISESLFNLFVYSKNIIMSRFTIQLPLLFNYLSSFLKSKKIWILSFIIFSSIDFYAQQTEKMSIGVGYSYQNLDMEKTFVEGQFVLDNNYGKKSKWDQETLDWFNNGVFKYKLHMPSINIFSGLSGSKETKLRFGFGLHVGLLLMNEKTTNNRDSLLRKNSSINLFGGGLIYAQYSINDKWLIQLDVQSSYHKGDLNDVTDYLDIFDDPELYTTNYDNSIEIINTTSFLRLAYNWKKFQFTLGPEFAFVYAKSVYVQRIYDITNDYYLVDYEDYNANNTLMIRGRIGAQYRIGSSLYSYVSLSVSKDIVANIGIQFQFSK